MVKKAVEVLEGELEAKETKFFAFEGMVRDEREVDNHTARQGAIQKTFELADVLRPRSDVTAGARSVIVNIEWPSWAPTPPAVTVNPQGDELTVG